ncbi:MAG: hypothetical protein FWF60_05730 [Oscillospiraceae bacterium]|nr:hypothetical protein [Oscillospiraceae bacterium]
MKNEITLRSLLRLCRKRRWGLFFLNLVAGLFAAPYLYWTCILMRVILRAAQGEPVLPWLNAIDALGGLPLAMLAMLGAGGCFSALRKLLRGEDGFLPREVFLGLRVRAKTSLLAGALLGASLGIARVGLLNLYIETSLGTLPAGAARAVAAAFLAAQLALALPLCLLALTREGPPARALAEAARIFAQNPLRVPGLALATVLPPALFFVWPSPPLTLLGFFFAALCGLVPAMLLWQAQTLDVRLQTSDNRRSRLPLVLGAFLLLGCLALALPFLRHTPGPSASLGDTLAFVSRLYADSGTLLRDLLAASSVWPLLLAALLGSACCVVAAYACACYRFRGRGLLFTAAVLLQILPIIASYSSLEQLLRSLDLPISGVWLGLGWALVYLLAALLLVRRFARLLPGLRENREKYPGARLFFYYALPRAPLLPLALLSLATLGCWADALAPFWYMRRLGAFSLLAYIGERFSGPGELALTIGAFLAAPGLLLLISRRPSSPPGPRP